MMPLPLRASLSADILIYVVLRADRAAEFRWGPEFRWGQAEFYYWKEADRFAVRHRKSELGKQQNSGWLRQDRRPA